MLLVAGNGRNSGKTLLTCRIISQFAGDAITGIKISHYYHEPSPGLSHISSGEGYLLYEEHGRGEKDSELMLGSGASRVYFVMVREGFLEPAVRQLLDIIPQGAPIVCEAQSLIYILEPGVFVIMTSDTGPNRKDISELRKHRHLSFTLDSLRQTAELPLEFTAGKWKISRKT